MAENNITFDLTDPNGTPAEQAVARIVAARTKELGETTEQACTALAINVLKSLRAATKLATLKTDITVEDVTQQYYPSFKREKGKKGKNISTRVLRAGGKFGSILTPKRVIWLCGKYRKGEQLHTYKVIDHISKEDEFQYLIVAETQKQAEQHAKKFHVAKVKRTRGLAKYVLGLAMHRVHSKESIGANVTNEAQSIGMKNAEVNVRTSGFNKGDVSISVHDKLDYAALALKNGEVEVGLAMQRALNSMTAFINKRLEGKGISDKLEIPYSEMPK